MPTKLASLLTLSENMLHKYGDTARSEKQTLLVYFNEFADSSLNIMVYCFTKTTGRNGCRASRMFTRYHGDYPENARLALPGQTLYISMTRDRARDKIKIAGAR